MLDLLYRIDMAFRGIHDADPSDTSVLSLQDRHRSHLVDTEQVRNLLIRHMVFSSCNMYFINNHIQICMFRWLQLQEILRPRQQMRAFMSMWRMDIRIQPYLIRSGFYRIFRLGHIMIDWPLITSLVERWRPETHVPCASRGDDDYLTGRRHPPWPTYTWSSSHWHMCVRCSNVVCGVARRHPTRRCC